MLFRFPDDDGSLYPHHIVVTDVAMWWRSMYFVHILQVAFSMSTLVNSFSSQIYYG